MCSKAATVARGEDESKRREELLRWIGRLPRAPKRVFVTHGEPVAADAFRHAIEEKHRWPASVPELMQTVELG